ncbi:hypothetical protein [Shewanella algae]|jgi:hypothetical protein|uniref:hypothetical protein n=1 Tax=Shewanella algae TaxID=38313 RepID=UPI000D1506B2|nr:hypothetical protein [Shewanella algae]PST68892.1 hypothetical protein AYI77_01990 [Shewanella algae]
MDFIKDKQHLHKQLIKLGDMIGDGLDTEPGGKWIRKEYAKVAKALGYGPDRSARNAEINKVMMKRCSDVSCGHCGGKLVQTRSGSKRAMCPSGHKWQLLK